MAIIAEGVPEADTKQLIGYARANNKVRGMIQCHVKHTDYSNDQAVISCLLMLLQVVIGPATVGGIQAGAFKIGDTAGTIDNIIQCKLYRPGSVGFVSKSVRSIPKLCSLFCMHYCRTVHLTLIPIDNLYLLLLAFHGYMSSILL